MSPPAIVIVPGFAFRLSVCQDSPQHWYFVLAGPSPEGEFLAVNFTGFSQYKDGECVVEVGDHPFVTKKTIVKYDSAEVWQTSKLIAGISAGHFDVGAVANAELLGRMLDGYWRSGRVHARCHNFAKKNMDRPKTS
jgi:hypothetical protein